MQTGIWRRKCSLSETPDFTRFGEFMIPPIYDNTLLNLSVLGLHVCYGLMIGLFGWINLTALSPTYLFNISLLSNLIS